MEEGLGKYSFPKQEVGFRHKGREGIESGRDFISSCSETMRGRPIGRIVHTQLLELDYPSSRQVIYLVLCPNQICPLKNSFNISPIPWTDYFSIPLGQDLHKLGSAEQVINLPPSDKSNLHSPLGQVIGLTFLG